MYCKYCGFKMKEGDTFCTNCGTKNNSDNNDNRNYYQPETEDKANVGLVILSVLIPLVGFILFLSTKDANPKSAKSYGKGALISFIIRIVFCIIAFALAFYAFDYATEEYNNGNWDSSIFDDYYDDDIEYFDYAVTNYVSLAKGKFYEDLYSDNTLTSKCYDIDDLEENSYYDGSIEVSLVDGDLHIVVWLTDYDYYISAIDYNDYSINKIEEGSEVEKSCASSSIQNSL